MKGLIKINNIDFDIANNPAIYKLLTPTNKNDEIIKNQEIQIANQQKQIDFAKEEAHDAKKESKKATITSIISIVIAIATLIYEIISSFLF